MNPDFDAETAQRELDHQLQVISVFRAARKYELSANHRRRTDFVSLPSWQQDLLPDYLDLLAEIDALILKNAHFLNAVADTAEDFISGLENAGSNGPSTSTLRQTDADHEKLRSTLRQTVRDWSQGGAEERASCYNPLLETLDDFGKDKCPDDVNVLVPGCGLGRLVWEIAKRGYSVQGNECSMYMLMMSNYLLNCSQSPESHTIYPWIHSLTNVIKADDMLEGHAIPDVWPRDLPPNANMSQMTAGDFVEVYSRPEHKHQWDVVITCFFIDTASNVIEYLTTIKHCLTRGGICKMF